MSCKCQECKRQFKANVVVHEETWEKIKPKGKPDGAGLLCGGCIIQKIEDLYGYIAFDLIKITE